MEKNRLASNCFHHDSIVAEINQLMKRIIVMSGEYEKP